MNDPNFSWLGHLLSASAIFGSIVGWFPGIAAFVAFVFYLIQIYESGVCRRWRLRHRDARIAKLKEALRQLETERK